MPTLPKEEKVGTALSAAAGVGINAKTAHNNNKKRSSNNNEITPITTDGDMPKKRFYRQRAHCNPLSHNNSFDYPRTPDDMDWKEHYPSGNRPTVLDVGCGFGGLTVALSTLLPEEYILGMEIRAKVTEYVRLRIVASRKENPGQYENCSIMRTNSMKYMPNYFPKASIAMLFFCFPDPHFKRKNHPRRIVSERLLSEYAYILKVSGRLYCITDVKELHEWHVQQCDSHPLFRRLSDDQLDQDPCVKAMTVETEEGKKVERSKGEKYSVVYERIEKPIALSTLNNFFNEDIGGRAATEEEDDEEDN